MSQGKTSLHTSTLTNWLSLGMNLLVGFFLTPYIIKTIGTEQFGLWSLIITVVGYYGFLDLGVTGAVMRYMTWHIAKKEHDELNRVFNTALLFFSFTGMIVIAVSLMAPRPLAYFFKIGEAGFIPFRNLILIVGISAGIIFPSRVFSTLIRAHEQWVTYNILQSVSTAIRGILAYLSLSSGGGVTGLALVYAAVEILFFLTAIAIVQLRYKELTISFQYISLSRLSPLMTFGFFSIIIQMGDLLRFQIDETLIAKYTDMTQVGVYAVAAQLFRYLSRISIATFSSIQPRLTVIAAEEGHINLSRAFLHYSGPVSLIIALFGVMAFTAGYDFLRLWLPASFTATNEAALVLNILIIGLVPDLMTGISVNALQALNKHRYYAWQTLIEGIANLILSLILVRYYGIMGVALGTALPALLTRLVIQPVYMSRILHFPLYPYMLQVLVKPLMLCAGVTGIMSITPTAWFPLFFIFIIGKTVLAAILYAIPAYLFILDSTIKDDIRLYVQNLFAGKKHGK